MISYQFEGIWVSEFEQTLRSLRRRELQAHFKAWFFIILFVGVIFYALLMISQPLQWQKALTAPQIAVLSPWGKDSSKINDADFDYELRKKLTHNFKNATDLPSEFAKSLQIVNYFSEKEAESSKRNIDARISQGGQPYNIIKDSIFSLGIALLGLYAFRVMLQFVRYYMVLAEFYSTSVTALLASKGDEGSIATFATIFSPLAVKLERQPVSPFETVIDALKAYKSSLRDPPQDSKG